MGWFRRRLAQIRYYSAPRRASQWSRLLDVLLVAALLAAWPLTWSLDRSVERRVEMTTVNGQLYEGATGVWAWVPPPMTPPDDALKRSVFFGAFRLDVTASDRGWPFATSRGVARAALNVELFESGRSVSAAEIEAGSPLRAAIEAALAEAGYGEAVRSLWSPSAETVTHRPVAWAANGITWSVLLVIAAWLGVTLLRVAFLPYEIARRLRRRRRETGTRCANCGYDLRGNLFSARCPECGALV